MVTKRRKRQILAIGRKNLEIILYQASFHPKDSVRHDSHDNKYPFLHTSPDPILRSLEDIFVWVKEDQLDEEHAGICVFCCIDTPSFRMGRIVASFEVDEFVINPKQDIKIDALAKETTYRQFGIISPTLQEEFRSMKLKQISLDSSLNFSFFVTISERFFRAFNEMQARKKAKKGEVEYIHRVSRYSSPTYLH